VWLKLQFSTVIGHQASLWPDDGCLMLKDENSTFLNGERIKKNIPIQVVQDDLIHFAEAPFRVRC
jgi:hypothetical protein